MGYSELTNPHKASNLPGYRGYCPQLKYECGHTYGIATDKLTSRHMKNEKLVPMTLTDSAARLPYLPQPNGDNKLTANMVPGYTGYVPTMRFLYATRYKEATEEAVSGFMKKDHAHRVDTDNLKTAVYSSQRLKSSPNYKDPVMYPDLKPRYTKGYFPSEHREFTEAPVPGYTGYVPRRREHDLGTRYATWSKGGYTESLGMRESQESTLTQPIDISRLPPATVKPITLEHGTLYKTRGMKPKYTGYLPQRRFVFGNTYGNTTRSLPVCHDPPGYAAGNYITTPVM